MRKPNPKLVDNIFRTTIVRPWRVLLPIIPKPRTPMSSSLMMVFGFAGMIVVGGVLLVLPMASKSGAATPPLDALFTATSAVCVTGLVVVDTANHWSFFGQIVIMVLIQLGGFGFMTSATLFLLAFGRRIGLKEKILISESIGVTRLGGVVKVVWLMAAFTTVMEAAGVALFYLHYSRGNPAGVSIWLSAFQSISSFNNAGFDLSGNFQSLIVYQKQPLVLLGTAALIIIGGISFLVITDFLRVKRNVHRLSLDSRLVVLTTVVLLALGTAAILLTEFRNSATLGSLPPSDMISNAFFQSVTARTAGFNSVSMEYLADYSLFLITILMFIGGASGSTAGGIKVNNFGMLAATMWSTVKGKEHAGAFGREFSVQQTNRALTIALLSVAFISAVVLVLTLTDGETRFIDLLFETVSAFSNVGLSVGITPGLSVAGRMIIVLTMFIGRLGPLTMAFALVQRQQIEAYRYPQETVRTG
jgi:trk system potassium uptake protein TrkH